MIIPVKDIPKPGPEYTTGYTQGRADQIAKHQEERGRQQVEVERLKHKGEQLDTIIEMVNPCDAGRYRHDILSVITGYKTSAVKAEADKAKLVETLTETKRRLAYMHNKFCSTTETEFVIHRADAVLKEVECNIQ